MIDRGAGTGRLAAARVSGIGSPVRGPVIVLTYAHSGWQLLMQALSASSSLAWTSNTGIVPLCHSAIATWQSIEGRQSPSALAVNSVRRLLETMTTAIVADSGGSRWCEVAFAGQAAAQTFLRISPATTFLCLHRSLHGVLAESAAAHPQEQQESPGGPPPAAPGPRDGAAAAARYWIVRTQMLLEFEDRHPHSGRRVRREDLDRDFAGESRAIFEFLGLDRRELHLLPAQSGALGPQESDGADQQQTLAEVDGLPQELLTKICELYARLGYEPLGSA